MDAARASNSETTPTEYLLFEEIFPDFGMTATLGGKGFTIDPDGNSPEIRFHETNNARDAECAFRQYLFQVLNTGTSNPNNFEFCDEVEN